MTTWNEVRRVRKELAEAIQVDCDLMEKQGQSDPWDVLKALDSTGEQWRWELRVEQSSGFDGAPLRVGSGIYKRGDAADLVFQVLEIADYGTTPDGDHVNVATQMWAEGWARKLRASK